MNTYLYGLLLIASLIIINVVVLFILEKTRKKLIDAENLAEHGRQFAFEVEAMLRTSESELGFYKDIAREYEKASDIPLPMMYDTVFNNLSEDNS